MKIPRDVTGLELANLLAVYGYEITRQKGSHIRLTTLENGEHHVTIPAHDPLKVGTLSSILQEVATHFDLTKKELTERLFD
jgi:predicted RNA binding protein YcfA (HicA-like mRNA interferase family)